MSKEFHIFTDTQPKYQQSFIFLVDRDNEENIIFDDLYLVTNTEHGEIRTRIKFQELIQSVLEEKGGNINNDGIVKVLELLNDVIPKEKQTEIMDDINYNETVNIDSNTLIKLSEEIVIESPLCHIQK